MKAKDCVLEIVIMLAIILCGSFLMSCLCHYGFKYKDTREHRIEWIYNNELEEIDIYTDTNFRGYKVYIEQTNKWILVPFDSVEFVAWDCDRVELIEYVNGDYKLRIYKGVFNYENNE